MNYQQERDTNSATDGVPALFIVNHTIQVRDRVEIFKNSRRCIERNAMFQPVDAILTFIPSQHHLYIQKCSTFGLRAGVEVSEDNRLLTRGVH